MSCAAGGRRADLEARRAQPRRVVAYCRGPYCVLSYAAVRLLRDHGRPARRLADGVLEWRAADLPVEGSDVA